MCNNELSSVDQPYKEASYHEISRNLEHQKFLVRQTTIPDQSQTNPRQIPDQSETNPRPNREKISKPDLIKYFFNNDFKFLCFF